MPSLCEVFLKSAAYVHHWLREQPRVKEESITDWLLYDISKNAIEVRYIAFTRHEEGRTTGADWEWWILFTDGAVRLRVQAKRLFDAKDNYPELARTNKHGLQITKLLSDSAAVNAFPLYAFYNDGYSGTTCPARTNTQEGVHLASALRVDQILLQKRGHVSSGDAMALANPISCLVCCSLTTGSASRFVEHLSRYHGLTETIRPAGYHVEAPRYVMDLIGLREGAREQLRAELPLELQDVGALFVVDRRDG